jgi:peroxiredoxin
MNEITRFPCMRISANAVLAGAIFLSAAATCFFHSQPLWAQGQKIVWTSQEKPIYEQIRTLRQLPDDTRARVTKDLALQIRQLPAGENKVHLALDLASLSTEGDFGHDTLQEVATTLAGALREHPVPREQDGPAAPYMELAELVRYEHVQASLDDPQFAGSAAKMEADDQSRQQADFTLSDLQGKSWTLRELQGKVVLVNFWATWCPPCRKEMPDLNALYGQFKDQGFVVLAISDEDASKVKVFIADKNITYPVLLDPEGKVATLFQVGGIPKSFVYDRTGKLVAQSIDMRTRGQFLEMLSHAGLH